MFRTQFARNVIGNVSLVAVIVGGLLFASSGLDLALWRDGRLTDLACALFVVALAVAVAALVRFDYLASRGRVSTRNMPAWLREPTDPR